MDLLFVSGPAHFTSNQAVRGPCLTPPVSCVEPEEMPQSASSGSLMSFRARSVWKVVQQHANVRKTATEKTKILS